MDVRLHISHLYVVSCIRNGKEIWSDVFENLVPEVGRNKYLDATLKTGLASPEWYVGLKGSGTAVDADIMSSHATWSELAVYSNSVRPTWTPGTIASGSVSNTALPAEFSINANSTVYGLFLCDDDTVSGASGTLLGVGDLTSPREVLIGDVIKAIVICNMLFGS
jgi:hypothetical protein